MRFGRGCHGGVVGIWRCQTWGKRRVSIKEAEGGKTKGGGYSFTIVSMGPRQNRPVPGPPLVRVYGTTSESAAVRIARLFMPWFTHTHTTTSRLGVTSTLDSLTPYPGPGTNSPPGRYCLTTMALGYSCSRYGTCNKNDIDPGGRQTERRRVRRLKHLYCSIVVLYGKEVSLYTCRYLRT
jgi:hypothetical protein